MAVMRNMREYTNVILVIVVFAFIGTIIFDWGMDLTGRSNKPGVIGKVNGTEIPARQFDEAFGREMQAYRDRTDREINENQIEFIRNQVWESLVRDIIVQQAIREKKIYASNQEIVHRIFENPPDFLKSQPDFQNDRKQFDMAIYKAAINNPSYSAQWRPVEEYLRLTLPYEKFQERIGASVRVTEDEIKREYLKQNQKAKVKYVFIDPNRFSKEDFEIGDEEIQNYYKANKEDFRQQEKRKIDYVIFPTKANAEDSAKIWETARGLMERAQGGEDFSELAAIYSEDTGSKDKGGDLGFFGPGAMVKPFEEAAFAAAPGDIVGPVESNFGLHIIKVEDKRIKDGKEEVSARHILIKYAASSQTINQAKEDAQYMTEEASNRPFDEIVSALDREIQTTGLFVKGSGFIPGLGLHRRASNFIFTNKVGKVGGAEEIPKGYFVCRIAEIQSERIQPLEEVKQTIVTRLKGERKRDKAAEFAQSAYDKIQSGTSFEDFASQDSLDIKETDSFARTGYVAGVGREPNFIGKAFALSNVGDVSKPVAAVRGYYLVTLLEKDEFDAADFEKKKDQILGAM